MAKASPILFVTCLSLLVLVGQAGEDERVALKKQTSLYRTRAPERRPQLFSEFSKRSRTCGLPELWRQTAGLAKPIYKPAPAAAVGDEVGDVRTFTAIDFTSEDRQGTLDVVARLERKGTHAYFYVDTTASFAAADLDSLVTLFDDRVYPTNREVFGSEPKPGIDQDDRLTILLLSIEEDAESGGDIAGYFWPGNQFPKSQVPKSNEREMLYAEVARLGKFGPDDLAGTLAHEFQHLIHWNYDPNEESWVNEGLSELATFRNGFPLPNPLELFLNNPDVTLMRWENHPRDYVRVFLWTLYAAEHYGGDPLTRAIVANPARGLSAFLEAVNQFVPGTAAEGLFRNWALANLLDGTESNPDEFEYFSLRLPPLQPTLRFGFLPVDRRGETVQNFAADYLVFQGGTDLVLKLDGPGGEPGFQASVVKLKSGEPPEVIAFPLDASNAGQLAFPDFGVTFDRLALVPSLTDPARVEKSADYTFSADGTGGQTTFVDTLQYHDNDSRTVIVLGLPSPILNNEHLDSYAVRFTPLSDGMLLGGDFAVWRRTGTGGTVRFYVYTDSGDSAGVPVAKIDSVDVPEVTGRPGRITWNPFDFSDRNIPIYKGEDFHLAWELVDAAPGDTVFAIVDTARTPTNRSSVYVRERQRWAHFVSGVNFFIRARVSVPADPTIPEVTAGLLQNPVFTAAVDVFAVARKPLNPASVQGTFTLGDSVHVLKFRAVSDSNTVFVDDGVRLFGSGVAEIVVSARHRFGTIVGSDTLQVRVDLVDRKQGGTVRSVDENLAITIGPETLPNTTYFTTIGLTEALRRRDWLSEGSFEDTRLGYTVGPPGIGFAEPAELTLHYGDDDEAVLSENNLEVAMLEEGGWVILGGELYREQKSISVLINRTGSYKLVVERPEGPATATELPTEFSLEQNYPNPFNPSTTIRFNLAEDRHATLRVVNLRGQVIATLVDGPLKRGTHVYQWDGTDDKKVRVASGVYLYQLKAGDFTATRKLVLVR